MKVSYKVLSTAALAAVVAPAVLAAPQVHAAEAVTINSVIVDVEGVQVVVSLTEYNMAYAGFNDQLYDYLNGDSENPTITGLVVDGKYVDLAAYNTEYVFNAGVVDSDILATISEISTEGFKVFKGFNEDGTVILEDLPGTELKVIEISAVPAKTVEFGTTAEQIQEQLGSKVTATLSNDTESELNVTWASESFLANKAGAYEFVGTVSAPEGSEIVVPAEKATVKVEVTVAEAAFEIKEVSAVNETSVKVTVPTTVKEADLADKKITLKSGENTVTATYVASSLTDKGEATFKLDAEAKLVDAQIYTVSSDWAKIASAEFVAKVVTPYVASFEKVTTGIAATTEDVTVTFSAKNQYGEEIAVPASAELEVKVNGMLLTSNEASYDNGVVTIKRDLAENDVVAISLTTRNADNKVVAQDAFKYTVVKAEAQKVTSIKLNPAKVSLPAKEATALNISVLDQFNNTVSGSLNDLRFVVNGKVVTPDANSDLIQVDANGKYTFKTSTPGEYKVEVYSLTNTKVSASTTITVGAATLTALTVDTPENVVTAANKRFNNEDVILATVAPSEGAALTPENLKFNVATTTTGLTANDVTVTAEKKTVGTGENATEVIVIKAKTTKVGTFTVTPYVGESFAAEGSILGNAVSFTTVVNPTVASISNFSFDTKALKAGATDVQAEVVFKNKHGEVLTAAQVANNNEESYTSTKSTLTGVVSVAQGTGDNAAKTYVNLAKLAAGTAQVTVQVGDIYKTAALTVVAPVLTTIDAGADVTGVVAGDTQDLAKYNAVKFLDQDGVELGAGAAQIEVTGLPTGADASDLVTLGTAEYDNEGKVTDFTAGGSTYNAVKILPAADLAAGTYTVTVKRDVTVDGKTTTVKDSFTVKVGAAREVTTVAATPKVSKLTVDGGTTVVVTTVDQYNNFKDIVGDIEGTNGEEPTKQQISEAIAAQLTVEATSGADYVTVDEDSYALVTNAKGELIGYSFDVVGAAKGTTAFKVTAKDKTTTFSITADSVANLVSDVEIKETALQNNSTKEGTGSVELEAIVKDSEGNTVQIADQDLSWTVTSVKDAAGNVLTYDATNKKYVNTTANVAYEAATPVSVTNGVLSAPKGLTIEVAVEVKTANQLTATTTVKLDKNPAKFVSGLAVTSTVAKAIDTDGDVTNGIQVALDGDSKDGEVAGAISFSLVGVDQYGNTFQIDEDDVTVTTDDRTVLTIGEATADQTEGTEGSVNISAKGEGTAKVYVTYGGETIALTFTVNQAAVAATAQ